MTGKQPQQERQMVERGGAQRGASHTSRKPAWVRDDGTTNDSTGADRDGRLRRIAAWTRRARAFGYDLSEEREHGDETPTTPEPCGGGDGDGPCQCDAVLTIGEDA